MIAGQRPWVWSAFVSGMALFFVAPTLIVFFISFSSGTILSFPPPGYSTRWYREFFSEPAWTRAAATSLKVGLLSMLVATMLGTLTALGLARGRYPGRALVTAVVLSPLIVPAVIVSLGMYIMYLRLHLVGTLLALVLSHTALGMPFVVVNVAAALRTVDRDLELAAQNLGAGRVETFFRVTLPLIAPGVAAGAIFAFITSWDEVIIALFLSTPLVQTLPVVMWSQVRSAVDPTVAAASAMVTGVSLSILLLLMLVRWRARLMR